MDISDIQRQMAQIRHDMHQEVQGAVKGAQSLTDWRSLVKSHPWISISVAAAAGYLIVPKRRSMSPSIVALENPSPDLLTARAARDAARQIKRPGWSIFGTAFSLLAPVAARAMQNYLLGRLDQWLSQHPLPPVPTASAGGPARDEQTASARPANRIREYG